VSKSSVETGNELEESIFKILLASNKRKLVREKRILGKKVDIYFEDKCGLAGNKAFVVECKNYTKKIGSKVASEILTEYGSRKDKFDILIIITRLGLTSDANDLINSEKYDKWVSHYTWHEFVNEMLDFGMYFDDIIELKNHKRLIEYYVPLKSKAGEPLKDVVASWINRESNQPLSILAGYGMGKSSFAKFISSFFAEEFLRESFSRIPVYLELGNLYNNQSIEGLVSLYFNSEHHVPNMSYSMFKRLNKEGLLLLIFDGFDEMKHAMSRLEFEEIFREIKDLCEGKSKVMILGRPSAFISDSEYSVLLGNDEETSNIKSPEVKFLVERIAELDEEQLSAFLSNRLRVLNQDEKSAGRSALGQEDLLKKENALLSEKYSGFINRPVHADMVCQLSMGSGQESFNQTTVYGLYKAFIDFLIGREKQKKSRSKIPAEKRMEFMMDVAWKFWPTAGQAGFSADDVDRVDIRIPKKVKPSFDMVREMLVGSVLDSKSNALFYFAHRSFQEYLISEYLLNKLDLSDEINLITKNVNSEIIQFINGSGKKTQFYLKIYGFLSMVRTPITEIIFNEIISIDEKSILEYHEKVIPKGYIQYFCYVKSLKVWEQKVNLSFWTNIGDKNSKISVIVATLLITDISDEIQNKIFNFILYECKVSYSTDIATHNKKYMRKASKKHSWTSIFNSAFNVRVVDGDVFFVLKKRKLLTECLKIVNLSTKLEVSESKKLKPVKAVDVFSLAKIKNDLFDDSEKSYFDRIAKLTK